MNKGGDLGDRRRGWTHRGRDRGRKRVRDIDGQNIPHQNDGHVEGQQRQGQKHRNVTAQMEKRE